jgi:hypothetical protein
MTQEIQLKRANSDKYQTVINDFLITRINNWAIITKSRFLVVDTIKNLCIIAPSLVGWLSGRKRRS